MEEDERTKAQLPDERPVSADAEPRKSTSLTSEPEETAQDSRQCRSENDVVITKRTSFLHEENNGKVELHEDGETGKSDIWPSTQNVWIVEETEELSAGDADNETTLKDDDAVSFPPPRLPHPSVANVDDDLRSSFDDEVFSDDAEDRDNKNGGVVKSVSLASEKDDGKSGDSLEDIFARVKGYKKEFDMEEDKGTDYSRQDTREDVTVLGRRKYLEDDYDDDTYFEQRRKSLQRPLAGVTTAAMSYKREATESSFESSFSSSKRAVRLEESYQRMEYEGGESKGRYVSASSAAYFASSGNDQKRLSSTGEIGFDDDDSRSDSAYDLCVAIADYNPDEVEADALPLHEGQVVEVLDSRSSHRWLVRTRPTKNQAQQQGWVPSTHLEKKSAIKSLQEAMLAESNLNYEEMGEEGIRKDAVNKRYTVVKELVETEEEFIRDMQHVVDTYYKEVEKKTVPLEVRDQKDDVLINFKDIFEFHNNILINAIKYYSDEPEKLGKVFLRMERDFDKHVVYCRDEPNAQTLLATSSVIKEFFEEFSERIGDVDKQLPDHLKLPIQRINDYQLLLKELIKYTAKLKEDYNDLQRALDFMLSIPQRAHDIQFLNSIEGYRGSLNKLGRLVRHDWFTITYKDGRSKERYLFLFKAAILVTKVKKLSDKRSIFILKDIIRLPQVEFRADSGESKRFEIYQTEDCTLVNPRYPLTVTAKTDVIRGAWIKEIKDFASDIAALLELAAEEDIEVVSDKVGHSSAETLIEGEEYRLDKDQSEADYDRTASIASLEETQVEETKEEPIEEKLKAVEVMAPKLSFIQQLKTVSCSSGDTVTLECELNQNATIAWLKGNQPLSQSNRVQASNKGNRYMLKISGASSADAAVYTIKANGGKDAITCSANVIVQTGLMPPEEELRPTTPGGTRVPKAPEFHVRLKDTELLQGTSVRFMVTVHGFPKPTVKFFKDGKELNDSDRMKIVWENDETAELCVTSFDEADAGKYKCVAKNSEGEVTTEGQFRITDDKEIFMGVNGNTKTPSPIPSLLADDPEFRWFRDGNEIDVNERFKVMFSDEQDSLALVFQHVKPEDAGLYTCVASTQSGRIACSAELTVQGAVNQLMREPEAPTITCQLIDCEVSEGASAMLELKVKGFPKPQVTWTKDGQEVKPGGRFKILHEDDESIALVIKQCTKEDAGKYIATAKNGLGETTTNGILGVRIAPKFRAKMHDMACMTDEPVKFEVEVEGKPVPEIKWYKDGKCLQESERIKMVQKSEELFALVIKKVIPDDAGSYSCVASNQSGQVTEFATLAVTVPPSFSKALKYTEVKEHENIKMEIKAEGTPPPLVKWMKDGQDLKADGHHVKFEQEDKLYYLIIERATGADEGKYSCEITNEHGKVSTTGELAVLCTPMFNLKLNDDMKAKIDSEDVRLDVSIHARPKPKIKWMFEKTEIITEDKTMKHYKIVEQGENVSLVIKKATLDVAGKYTCEATNAMGTARTVGTFTVTTKPQMLQGLSNSEVTEGETIKLRTKISGIPQPFVKWSQGGEDVFMQERLKLSRENGEIYCLEIRDAATSDATTYECKATNTDGEVSSTCKLTVNTQPKFDKTAFGAVEAWCGEKQVFQVKISAIPEAKVTWFKDGAEVKSSDAIAIVQEGTVHKLIIKDATVADSGAYKCVAKNKIKETIIEGTLAVKLLENANKPAVVRSPEETVVVHGEKAVFEAKIVGTPTPTVKWYLDNKEVVETDRIRLIEYPDEYKFCLVIDNCTMADMGTVTLKIANEHGEASADALLDVRVPPAISRVSDATAMPENKAFFEATVTGRPQPAVKWLKGNTVLKADGNIVVTEDETAQKYTLTFKHSALTDAGEYSCVAENDYGKAQQTFKLNVTTNQPTFKRPLTNLAVKPNKNARFEVEVDGIPLPTVKWLKDKCPIEDLRDAARFKALQDDDAVFSLEIHPFIAEDEGRITAQAINPVGVGESIATLSVKHEAPVFLKNLPKMLGVMDTETFSLEGKVEGSPHPTAEWKKDGRKLAPSDVYEIAADEQQGTIKLTVKNAKPSDAGSYTATISNQSGSVASSSQVDVDEDVTKPPTFGHKLEDTELIDGQPGKVSAKVKGHPRPHVKWLKDGKPIKPDGRIHFAEEPDGTVALVFDEVRPEDKGKYTLQLKNNHGEDTCDVNVGVTCPETVPTFDTELKDASVIEGYPAHFEAKASGRPSPDFKWMKGDEEITPDGDKIIIKTKPDGSSVLVIDKVKPSDAGRYSCVASNGKGERKSSANLGVTSKFNKGEPPSAPVFTTPLADLSVDEGAHLKLHALIGGNPKPEIDWRKDGQPLRLSDGIDFVHDFPKIGLDIRRPRPTDSGLYECILRNEHGSTSSASNVNVNKTSLPPHFLQKLQNLHTIPGGEPRFLCKIGGNPKPNITWYYNDKPISASDKYKIKIDGDLSVLYVRNAQLGDRGTYSCKAENFAGEDTTSGKLEVGTGMDEKDKSEAPSFMKKLGDCDVIEGMMAKFTACVMGIPEPEFKWYKDGAEIRGSDRIKMEVEPHGLLRLIIKDVREDDVGKYSLRIKNIHGEAESSGRLGFEQTEVRKPMADLNIDYSKMLRKPGWPNPLPDKPIISKMTDRRLTLSWKPSLPNMPGGTGMPVTYIVEMLELPDGDWLSVRTGIRGSCCEIRNLEPFRDYKFRIRVENRIGVSDPSPYNIAYRTRLEQSPPKYIPHLYPQIDFRPDSSPFFPKDYDIDRPAHEAYAHAPRFLHREDDTQYGVKGQPSNIEWWVYGYPTPDIHYLFNDEKVETGGRYDSVNNRNGQCTLFINRFLERDVGIYECVAKNEHGESRRRVRYEIAEPPVFRHSLEQTSITVRDEGYIECRVVGVPYPQIKWFKDWQPIVSSDRIRIEWKEPDLCRLTITNAINKDSGLYSCSASNVAGVSSSSAFINIEENEQDCHYLTYRSGRVVKPRTNLFEDFYLLGDELGRGTQGVTYHTVENSTGHSYAAKVMYGKDDRTIDWMNRELDMMNQLHSRYLIRAIDAYRSKDSLVLVTELGSGGDFLDFVTRHKYWSETDVAYYIRQILWGLEHAHSKGIAHLGLTPGDLLFSRPGGDEIRIGDFGLAQRITKGKHSYSEYGMPEYVAPECIVRQPVGYYTDMWSVGIISYLLLSGVSPFYGENDRATLDKVKLGRYEFDETIFKLVSDEARDFIRRLLLIDIHERMDVRTALRHPWLRLADRSGSGHGEPLGIAERMLNYHRKYRDWNRNSACRRYYRRRPLQSAFDHPSRMVYPPGEQYTPPDSPEITPKIMGTKFPLPPKDPADYNINREALDYDLEPFGSESRYQQGPDTYLLQLRDVGLPMRLREYMRVAGQRSPSMAFRLHDQLSGKIVTVKERRRFHDMMDEVIDDEKEGHDESIKKRLGNELSSRSETRDRLRELLPARREEGLPPFFREKIEDKAIKEETPCQLTCYAIGDPKPSVQWYRNDILLSESCRVKMTEDLDGKCTLRFEPSKAFDVGVYKVMARNLLGSAVCRARVRLGELPGRPDIPEIKQVSESELFVEWGATKDDGHSVILCYALQVKETTQAPADWKVVADNIDHEFYVLRDLTPHMEYHVRVKARNKFGWGDWTLPSDPARTIASADAKVQLTRAQKYEQEMTDSGRPVDASSRRPSIDYDVEDLHIQLNIDVQPTNSYDFIAEIHKGRYSTVVKCKRRDSGKVLAAKILDASRGRESLARQEYDMMKSLRHERIPLLHDGFRAGDIYVLVVEKLQGTDVLSYLTAKPEYSEDTVAKIISQVLNALEYLHFRNLVHLDVQPDNIVMARPRCNSVKLTDYGSCKYLPSHASVQIQPIGPIDFAAPEIIGKQDVNAPVDIWSVAVVTYILMSGVSPFLGATDEDTKSNITFVRYKFENLYKQITAEVSRFLMSIFKRTPQKRAVVSELLEQKWLSPSEFLLKKREKAIFPSDKLKAFTEAYRKQRADSAPSSGVNLLSAFGQTSFARSVSIDTDSKVTF